MNMMVPMVDKVGHLKQQGCHLHIILGVKIGVDVVDEFKKYNITPLQSGCPITQCQHPGVHSHMKDILVFHRYNGKTHISEIMSAGNMGVHWFSENNAVKFHPTASQVTKSMVQFNKIAALAHPIN
jgi:hypothetical protein